MPVQTCRSDGKPGYRWGNAGRCYTYTSGDDAGRREAKRKAIIQGTVIERRSGQQGLTGVQFSAVVEQAVADAEAKYLIPMVASWRLALETAGLKASDRFALTAAAADWQPPPEGWVLTPEALAAITVGLNESLTVPRENVVRDVGSAPLVKIGIAWDIKAPLIAGQLEAAAQRTGANLGLAVQFRLREIIGKAWEEGLSVRDTSALIRAGIGESAPWQADMLARTDLNSLANGASKASAQVAGMGYKTWLTAADEKVRPDHQDAEGQTVPLDQPFSVGGEDAQYPGDPALSDAQAANCRCTLIYGETLGEAEGLLADAGAAMIQPMATARQRARRHARRRAAAPSAVTSLRRVVPQTDTPLPDSDLGGDPNVLSADAIHEPPAVLAAARPVGFAGVATIEGKLSDDNSIAPRMLLPDSLSWPEMPRPFMAQTRTAEGHEGAEIAGRIDSFARRRGTKRMRMIEFAGELTNEFGVNEIAPMIADQTMKYVSADLGASKWAFVDRGSFDIVPMDQLDEQLAHEGAYAYGLTEGKLKAVTLVATQAIEGAMVALTAAADAHGSAFQRLDDDEDGEVWRVVMPVQRVDIAADSALVASAEEWAPPAAWFETQEPPGKMPLTVSEDGRVYGHLATWDSCHMSFLPSCVPPPRSASNYAYFHVCEIDTDEGIPLTVGKLMFSPTDGGHADRRLTAQNASKYYDRTGMVAAVLRVEDGEHGIWACGSLNPALTPEQRKQMRRELRLHPPSGDWRPVNGQYELICGLAVAVPGYPVARVSITASGDGLELEDAIILSSGVIEPDDKVLAALEHDGLLNDELLAERRLRTLAARAEGIEALAALAGE